MAIWTSVWLSAVSAGNAAWSFWVRANPSLPAIHLDGAISPNTIASKTPPDFSIVSTLPPRWVRLAGVTQATSVLSAITVFFAASAPSVDKAPSSTTAVAAMVIQSCGTKLTGRGWFLRCVCSFVELQCVLVVSS